MVETAGLGLPARVPAARSQEWVWRPVFFEVSAVEDLRSNTSSQKSNPATLSTTEQAIKAACECRHCACYQLGGGCCYCERKIERCVWESLEHELRDHKVR